MLRTPFVNRKTELELLLRDLSRRDYSTVLVYGRRRRERYGL